MFIFSNTSDKVLDIILENQDLPVPELIGAIKSRLGLSQAEVDSMLAKLSKQNLITAVYADDKLYALQLQPSAYSQLIAKRESKREDRFWKLVPIIISTFAFIEATISLAQALHWIDITK